MAINTASPHKSNECKDVKNHERYVGVTTVGAVSKGDPA